MVLPYLAVILPLTTIGVAIRWPQPRRQLAWGALFGLPVVVVILVMAGDIQRLGVGSADVALTIILLILAAGAASALAAVSYERWVNRWLTPVASQERGRLWWLGVGLVLALLLAVVQVPLFLALAIGLLVNVLIVTRLGHYALMWDALMSAIGFGVWYVVLIVVLSPRTAGDLGPFLLGPSSLGLTAASVPIEELLAAASAGALLGPLFAATKLRRSVIPWRRHVSSAKMSLGVGCLLAVLFAFSWGVNEYVLPPKLLAATPIMDAAGIMTSTGIDLTFSRAIDREALDISLSNGFDGSWFFSESTSSLHGYRRAHFQFSTTLLPNTRYRGNITGIQSIWGSAAPDIAIDFTTRNQTDIDALVLPPQSGDQAPRVDPCQPLAIAFASAYDPSSEFTVTLEPATPLKTMLDHDRQGLHVFPDRCFPDDAVHHLRVDRRLVVRDPATGEVIEAGETMTVYQTTFTTGRATSAVVVPSTGQVLGVANEVGAAALTVLRPQKVLPIKVDYQDRPLSCEAAALKMALAGRGVRVSESAIMKIVGYDPTPHRGNIWGDPDKAFVGNIAGRQNTTGYGVHWRPIARAGARWRPTRVVTNLTPVRLAAELAKNHPVVIWGTMGRAVRTPWKTPSGKVIAAWKGEHARTVIGFYGPASNPTHFVINDPIAGRLTWTKATLLANWSSFGGSGVVIE